MVHHFFKRIENFSCWDLMSTVAPYLNIETGSAETQSETAAISIRYAIFLVGILNRVRFTNKRFFFRSIINGTAIDTRTPDLSFFVGFAPRLPQTLIPSPIGIEFPSIATATTHTATPTATIYLN